MPATPITDPATGESLVGTEPQLLQQVDPGWWRQRLNLYTGRALTKPALNSEQYYRGGLLATLGQAVTPGTVSGLALTMDTSGADPLLSISPGYGITANGEDVVLRSTLKAGLSTLTVIDLLTGDKLYDSFHQSVGDPTNSTYAGILLLQPVIAQVSGKQLDTGSGPIEVSGNLGASCSQDPAEYAFEDWQIADAVRLVYLPWPDGIPALPLPPVAPVATWRNRLAYAIFEAEALLGPDDQLPWAMLGLPVALIAFDPGIGWKADTPYTVGELITDTNSNQQLVQTAGTSGGLEPAHWSTVYRGLTTDGSATWINSGLAWKPLFVDCSAVVRAGGLPRSRFVLPAQPAPLLLWRSLTDFVVNDFIIDPNGNVQQAQTVGKSADLPPQWKTVFGQTTTDGTVTWINNGPASWQPNTAFTAGQFLYDGNGNMQHVQTAGVSGGAEPDWNGVYLPTTDGTVTWINNGSGNPPIIQPGLAQARINQLSEQLSQTMAVQQSFNNLADIFSTLPPSGILPVAALDFDNHTAPWFPRNWSISAAPVHLEELETVLETGMLLDLIPAQRLLQENRVADIMEPVEVLVPLPDAVYDPDILVAETVAPIFTQEFDRATDARNLTLQQLKTVELETNTLFSSAGPNVPVNPNLIDTDAGLTAGELAGRNAPPPYTPAATETFGTVLQSTWQASSAYTAGQFVIDGNGAIQVAMTAGTTGTTAPVWSTTIADTTSDGTTTPVTWMNNGPWSWQPNTAYVKAQFVVDPRGYLQTVTAAGTSAAATPNWLQPEKQGGITPDGILWQNGGKAFWETDYLYSVGQLVLDARGNVQMVQTGGISGDNVPQWNPTAGQTTQDSGVAWQNLGHFAWQANTFYSAGQAILDAAGFIQVATIGGTSGATPPEWIDTENSITVDAAVSWTNGGPIIWQAGVEYAAGQIIIDGNGNLQCAEILDAGGNPEVVGTKGKSGAKTPGWNTTPTGTTTDGAITWVVLAYYSKDLLQLQSVASQAPYTKTFQDSSNNSYTISLLNQNDLNNLETNGLQALITSLSARVAQANDLLDTAFLTAQTDIYRFRQNVLGATAATTLATSPVLANIATGETAAATSENLRAYINTLQPPPSNVTPNFTPSPPVYNINPILHIITDPVVLNNTAFQSKAAATRMDMIRKQAVGSAMNEVSTAAPQATSEVSDYTSAYRNLLQSESALGHAFSKAATAGPTEIVFPGKNVAANTADITNQSPIIGAQLNIRTLTIAERLQQSPSQEAMFYGIANRLSFLQVLETLETDLNLVADDLPILVDAAQTGNPPSPAAVKVPPYTFSEWLGTNTKLGTTYPNNQAAITTQIQSPYLIADSSEATLFSVGVRVVEQHTMLLRALEARVQLYADFVTLCTNALNSIQGNLQQAQVYTTQLWNNLLQQRQDVAFTSALLSDETQRVQSVNAQRRQVLATSVQLIAYTRARTLDAIDTTPSRQLVPANVTNPVPACLQQSVAIPPELREIVGQLREAPVNWLPAAASQLNNLERPILLQQLALSTQTRAVQMLQIPLLPSSAVGETGVYASTIASVYSNNQQVFRNYQTQRTAIQPAALNYLSWKLQVAYAQNIVAINDLISADSVHTEISNTIARMIQQISSVATCLYTRVSIALPINRLTWAEYLRGVGLSVQLRSLAILPGWNQLSYSDRQQMQMLVDWLFLQIDNTNSAAMSFMSDVVRTAILLASDVPIDNIVSGSVIARTQPALGGIVSLSLPSDRISAGMFVNLYSGATLAARAVVSDLDSSTVSATVTDVFTPGTYLETTDTAHFTTLTPQAVALRPLFMLS